MSKKHLLPQGLRVKVIAGKLNPQMPCGWAIVKGVATTGAPVLGRNYILGAGRALAEYFNDNDYPYESFVCPEAFLSVYAGDLNLHCDLMPEDLDFVGEVIES